MFSFKNQKRFWSKVNCTNNLDECWNWIGLKDKDGYGKIKICGKTIRSHRYVYSLYHNFMMLNKNNFICHTCDNPSCVNPNYLFLGTAKDNVYDMVNKHRQPHGVTHGNSKLTDNDILKIFDFYYNDNLSFSKIGKIFSVSSTTISYIIKNRSWKHINNRKYIYCIF